MELKNYQELVIHDIELFMDHVQKTKDVRTAFHNFWSKHPKNPLIPRLGSAIEPYKDVIPKVPHVCVKVPTAGGKTFIASCALKTIFAAFPTEKPKVVVWLVPSIIILDQTIKNLSDSFHPYRQKINTHFANRVEVYDKNALLKGSGFTLTKVQEQLSILVFSYDSLRARNKEDRKVFQENGNLHSFENYILASEDLTLGSVIKALNPVIVVDESHNAESALTL